MKKKKATTIEEQLEIIKERGIILDYSEEKCKEILSDIGYFRFGCTSLEDTRILQFWCN
jgi:abortive infection bacteriophage resistance protein